MRPGSICFILLFGFLLLGNNRSFAQNLLKYKLRIAGNFLLHEALDSIRSEVNIAYSPDKLPNKQISIEKGSTVKQLFDLLEKRKFLSYKATATELIISPYEIKSYTINGVLRDAESGEHIIGGSVQVIGTSYGAFTNGYGYFSITLFEGTYDLKFAHIGYSSQEVEIDLSNNVYLKTSILSETTTLDEVEVSAVPSNHNITGSIPSVNRIFIKQTDGQIPYFLGEVDVIQNALLQPGIKSIGEDASGIHVRGGAVDQNLTLLDEAPIYNPNHFFGLISVFNPEAVNDVRILKGFIPPSYGGRASSVIEVRQKEGNANKHSYSGGIGILSARGLIEGPLKKGKSSFLISGRQSLLNLSLDDFASTSVRRNRVRFQDFNFKINSRPNSSNQYYFSGYVGSDRNAVGLNSIRRWGNRVGTFRWNHLYSPQLFSHFSAFISEYNYRIENDEDPGAFVGRSKIRDLGIKTDFSYSFESSNEVSFGFSTIYHRLSPGSREPLDQDASTNVIELDRERGLESAVYLGHNFTLGSLNFNYGIRQSMLHNFGPGNIFLYENDNPTSDTAIIDTLSFSSGELINMFSNIEPRLAINWIINPKTSIKSSFSRSAQYIHLISNTISPAPTDIWKLTNRYIPPLISDQYTLGFYKNILNDKWQFSTEVYFKDITNNIQYKNGADLIFNENIETELLLSNARAYGVELYVRKQKGKIKGWLSYTLSRAESRLNENETNRFVVENHDKTHDLSTSWNMNISKRLSISSNFIYNTGIPVTLPTDKYVFEDNLIPHFTERNNSRLPDYHRLDLSFRLEGKELRKSGAKRKNRDYWILTIYNVYARKNAYSYFFRESETNPGLGEIVQYSIFGTVIPAITYNFKF